jgi:hypothetical protein
MDILFETMTETTRPSASSAARPPFFILGEPMDEYHDVRARARKDGAQTAGITLDIFTRAANRH